MSGHPDMLVGDGRPLTSVVVLRGSEFRARLRRRQGAWDRDWAHQTAQRIYELPIIHGYREAKRILSGTWRSYCVTHWLLPRLSGLVAAYEAMEARGEVDLNPPPPRAIRDAKGRILAGAFSRAEAALLEGWSPRPSRPGFMGQKAGAA